MVEGSRGSQGDDTGRGEGAPSRASWAAQATTHRVIRGRRWRVSDPRIPEDLRQRLVDELANRQRPS